jgi:hypothetical protein
MTQGEFFFDDMCDGWKAKDPGEHGKAQPPHIHKYGPGSMKLVIYLHHSI